MQHSSIQEAIIQLLSGCDQATVLDLVFDLEQRGITFKRDECDYWKGKHYYWRLLNEQCVCFISIMNPEEPANRWTVWTDDMDSALLDDPYAEQSIKEAAWKYADHCSHCGSCSGGRYKMIYGIPFTDICGCTFRVDNPTPTDLVFLKKMLTLRLNQAKSL